MFKPCTQSVRSLPQSTRQMVSEQDRLQSTYSSSHWTSHFAAISSSLKTDNRKLDVTGCKVVGKLYSRAGFRKIQFQETRAGRGKNQNKYFISHDCNEVIICAPIKYKKLTYAKILNTSTVYFTRSLVVGLQLRMCLEPHNVYKRVSEKSNLSNITRITVRLLTVAPFLPYHLTNAFYDLPECIKKPLPNESLEFVSQI